jgi:hypothetical protein
MALRKSMRWGGIIAASLIFSMGLSYMILKSKPVDKTIFHEIAAEDGSSFIIIPADQHDEIFDLYEDLIKKNSQQLITTDLVLHTAHLLYNYTIRIIEVEFLAASLKQLSTKLALAAVQLEKTITAKELLTAARGVTAYFSMAATILDDNFIIPLSVQEEVKADLELINRHQGFNRSHIIPYMEDFSQYIPRGHYTRNRIFQQYFKAMMWFQRRLFRVEERSPEGIPGGDLWDEEMMFRETRQMLIILYLLENTQTRDKSIIDLYKNINDPLTLLIGQSEDLDIPKIRDLAKQVWGKTPAPANLLDNGELKKFILLARKATQPKIDASGTERKGFPLFGQRFLPDSFIMQSLVSKRGSLKYIGDRKKKPFTYGIVEPYGPVRTFPRGLDIFAALGSDRALRVLSDAGDTSYIDYPEKMSVLRKKLTPILQEGKTKSLFYSLIYSLKQLLSIPGGKNLPGVFSTPGWSLKQLNTSLASWAEFRHDSVLYAKQSYTAVGEAPMATSAPPGYVEPYPDFYRQIRELISKMYDKVVSTSIYARELKMNFQEFEKVMERLIEISNKELEDKELNENDWRDISEFALRLKSTTQFPYQILMKISGEGNTKMAVVTDVHTDSNSEMVLQEGIGPPFLLKLKMRQKNKTIVLTGGIFSYYEFKHPIKDRLTDERWQETILRKSHIPLLSNWLLNISQ